MIRKKKLWRVLSKPNQKVLEEAKIRKSRKRRRAASPAMTRKMMRVHLILIARSRTICQRGIGGGLISSAESVVIWDTWRKTANRNSLKQ